MELTALIIAIGALLTALIAMGRASAARRELEDGLTDARRTARNVGEELGNALEVQKKLLAKLASGEKLDPQMVLEGQLWRDVGPAEGKRMLEEQSDLVVIDVRTPQETSLGVIAGALRIPVDEIEARKAEIPRSAPKLLYCAAGARSAAACEFLSHNGYEGLHNLEGGFPGWTGPKE